MGWDQYKLLEKEINELKEIVTDMGITLVHVNGVVGSGCLISAYTTREYLYGYTMRIKDGTIAKSTKIVYDPDNERWHGELVVPCKKDITIELISEDRIQASFNTTADITTGYSVINLDALIEANIKQILDKDDLLFDIFCQDATYVNNQTYKNQILAQVIDNPERRRFDRTFNLIEGVPAITAKTLDELFENIPELLNVIRGFGSNFLELPTNVDIMGKCIRKDIITAMWDDYSFSQSFMEGYANFNARLLESPYVTEVRSEVNMDYTLEEDMILLQYQPLCIGKQQNFGSRSGTGQFGSGNYRSITLLNCTLYASKTSATYTVGLDGSERVLLNGQQTSGGSTSGWSGYASSDSSPSRRGNVSITGAVSTFGPSWSRWCTKIQQPAVEGFSITERADQIQDSMDTLPISSSDITSPRIIKYIKLSDLPE